MVSESDANLQCIGECSGEKSWIGFAVGVEGVPLKSGGEAGRPATGTTFADLMVASREP